jgi:hypothetical protein
MMDGTSGFSLLRATVSLSAIKPYVQTRRLNQAIKPGNQFSDQTNLVLASLLHRACTNLVLASLLHRACTNLVLPWKLATCTSSGGQHGA